MTVTGQPRSGRAMTALRRAAGLRYVNGQLVRASEAIIGSARAWRRRG